MNKNYFSKKSLFFVLIFSVSSNSSISLGEMQKAVLNVKHLETTGPCNIFVEQACNDVNPSELRLTAASALSLAGPSFKMMNLKPILINSYHQNSNMCASGDERLHSISYKQAAPQSIDSDFVLSWFQRQDGWTCVTLKTHYDSHPKNDYVPIRYRTHEMDPSTGQNKWGELSTCNLTFAMALEDILGTVQLKCVHIGQMVSADPKYEKPILQKADPEVLSENDQAVETVKSYSTKKTKNMQRGSGRTVL